MKRYHFISGLPRAGSTLLSAILKQNPRFTAGISDPLQSYAGSIIRDTNSAVGMEAAVPIEKRRELIHGLFDSFYQHDREVCFNTNRGWAGTTSLLKDLFPDFKMIVCLREVPWILDSFEQLNAKNPYTIKALYHHQELSTVHDRCSVLMGEVPNLAGYVRGPLVNVQQAMFANEYQHLCFVEYDTLVKNPRGAMQEIYEFLDEPWFEHDFTDVEDSYDEFDEQAKIVGLHTVRKEVRYIQRRSILPQELWDKYQGFSFWKNSDFERRKHLTWVHGSVRSTFQPSDTKTAPQAQPTTIKSLPNPALKYPVPSGFRQL